MSESTNKDKPSASSTIAATANASTLPKEVYELLEKGLKEGIDEGYLDLYNKSIDDKMVPELCQWINILADKVKIVMLSKNNLSSSGLIHLFDRLRTINSRIVSLYISCYPSLNDDCMKSLGEYVKSNKSIKELDLGTAQISDAGIELLAPYFDGNTNITSIFIQNNVRITNNSIPIFKKMIESSHIEDIKTKDTLITKENELVVSFAHNIIRYGSKSMMFYNRQMKDEYLATICRFMKKYGMDNLMEINFPYHQVTSKGAIMLFDTLRECNAIVSTLILSGNKLDDDCMSSLGELISHSDYLEILNICNNNITDKGIELLSDHIIGNGKLKDLNLSNCVQITDASFPIFMELAKSSSITYIEVWGTSISDSNETKINKAFNKPVEERNIPLKSKTKSAAKTT